MKSNTIFIALSIIFLLCMLVWGIHTKRTYQPIPSLSNMRVGIFLPSRVGISPDSLFARDESAAIRSAIDAYKDHYQSMGIVLNIKGASTIRDFHKANQPDAAASFNMVIQTKSGSMLETGKVQTTRKDLSREIVSKITKGFKIYEEVATTNSTDQRNPKIIMGF